jgi:hypothetical protein
MSRPTVLEGHPAHAPNPAAPRGPGGIALAEAAGMSKAPRTTHDDFEAIDRYVAATFDRYRRTLVAHLPAFAEPRVADPARALARLRFLVETLAGFAIGSAIGTVATEARRGFGEEVRAGVSRVLGRVMVDDAPRAAVSELMVPAPFLRDPSRPLLDELGAQLHARLCAAVTQARAHVALVHAEITREAPARLRAFADALDRLAADDTSAVAFADQLAAGWRSYTAAVQVRAPGEGATQGRAAITGATGTWDAWTSRLAGPAPAPEPTQAQVVAEGFLMRIA